MRSTRIRRYVPGLAVIVAIAASATVIGNSITGVAPLVVAVALGALLANTVGCPTWAEPGIDTHKLLLETGIVLLGASISLVAVVAAGPQLIAAVVGVVALGILLVEALARLAGLAGRAGSLLAAGSSICGVSAVVAVAAACRADDSTVAYAAATVLLFDAVTLAVFPVLGAILGMEARAFGVWVGLSMFSTGPVAAAGFAHSTVAGEWATLTKLTRNALIGAVAVGYALWYSRSTGSKPEGSFLRRLAAGVPPFLVGFLLLAIVANAGILPTGTTDLLSTASSTLFLLAFAGLGFEIQVSKMRATGITPIAVVGVYLIAVTITTYLLVTALF